MSAIVVESIAAGPLDRNVTYEVLIDGQARGRVKCGETGLFEVLPGIHTVKLATQACSPPPVKVVVGFGKTSLVCQTTRRRFGLFFGTTPGTQIAIREETEGPPNSAIVWRNDQQAAGGRIMSASAD